MINFFRKIRYNLMEQNKTGKYLKYAIGEIVLVVLGILIALSINNWNEGRKFQRVEVKILQEMLPLRRPGSVSCQYVFISLNVVICFFSMGWSEVEHTHEYINQRKKVDQVNSHPLDRKVICNSIIHGTYLTKYVIG